MGGPGIESRGGEIFQTGPGAHLASYAMDTGSYPGVKRQGRGVEHPPPYSAEVKKRVEPITLLPPLLWAFMVCSRVNFTYTIAFIRNEAQH
jgi:hypothetical protein